MHCSVKLNAVCTLFTLVSFPNPRFQKNKCIFQTSLLLSFWYFVIPLLCWKHLYRNDDHHGRSFKSFAWIFIEWWHKVRGNGNKLRHLWLSKRAISAACQTSNKLSDIRRGTRRCPAPDDGGITFTAALCSFPSSRCLFATTCSSCNNNNNFSGAEVQFLRTLFNSSNQCQPVETRRHRDHRFHGRLGQRCLWR